MDTTLSSLWSQYRDESVILRTKNYAYWTLPQLMVEPNLTVNGTTAAVEKDYQEIGALLVNNLSAKLANILFPASRPFFKISASAQLKKEAAAKGVSEDDVNSSLARMEMEACSQIFVNASYNQLVQGIKHLIVTGNVLLYRDADAKKTIAYGLQNFGIRRDRLGVMLDCVLKERMAFDSLSPDLQFELKSFNNTKYLDHNGTGKVVVDLYTRIKRETTLNGNPIYEVTQEIDGKPVGTKATYNASICPWQAPMWNHIAGENYGRGLVEDYAGGFAKLSDTAHALALYGIEALKVVNLVAPGSGTDIDSLAQAETGEYVQGQRNAVESLETGANGKIKEAQGVMQDIFMNLSKAFMYTGNTRTAERVTAYEIKIQAMEAETTLGGIYSSLAEAIQIPFAHILLLEVQPGMLEGIITNHTKLNIMAGIPALGRATDVENLLGAAQEIGAILPVFLQMDKTIDPKKIIDMIMAGRSVDVASLRKSPEQIKADNEAQQQQAQGQEQLAQAQAMAAQADQLKQLQGG